MGGPRVIPGYQHAENGAVDTLLGGVALLVDVHQVVVEYKRFKAKVGLRGV